MKTIYRPARIIALAVLAILLFFPKIRAPFEGLVIKSAGLLMPESGSQMKSLSDVMLLESIKDLKTENERLRGILNLNYKIIKPAKIILNGGYVFTDVLILNEGQEAGIKIGDIVFTPENILVGQITEVGSSWSKVRPISALGEKTVLRGGANKEIVVEAEGVGAGELKSALPPDLQVQPGEVLWWGGDPRIIAAIVDRVDRVSSNPFSNIIILSPTRLLSISDVLVAEQ